MAVMTIWFAAPGGHGRAMTTPGTVGGRLSPTSLAGVGDNGLRVDPYTKGVTADDVGHCEDVLVAAWALQDLCGDDDGCDLRLVGDGLPDRVAAATRSFVIDADLRKWFVNTSFTGGSAGTNGDVIETNVVRIASGTGDCTLLDDLSADVGLYFHLQACSSFGDKVTCVLRIDD